MSALTLVELLRARAAVDAGAARYLFLPGGDRPAVELGYAELDRRARAVATALRRYVAPGDRVLVLLPPGLDYVAAFFGCLYAGAVAVPAYPPRARGSRRGLPRLRALVASAAPAGALTSASLDAASLRNVDPAFVGIRTIAFEDVSASGADAWVPPELTADSVAFIQYTSGSIAEPRGVVLTHADLLYNLALIEEAFEHDERTVGCSWLPPYHDMGLIGGVLQPLFTGFPVVLMPPRAFVQRPREWLEAITAYGVTTTGGPNFSYDLCADRVLADDLDGLDLSTWSIAFNGAEPVRAETLERFARQFERCGFHRDAFLPCYGLAEATLLVSGGPPAAEPVVLEVSADALEAHRVEPPAAGAKASTVVGSGVPARGVEVEVVDPERLVPVGPGAVGEIWLAGPSVAAGYWAAPDESARVFGARLAGGRGPFLRTGDLGFVRDRVVFVTGRLKDLIVIRGRNHYPQDVELTAERSDPALAAGGAAAFSTDVDDEERLVVVHEVTRHVGADELERAAAAICAAVSDEHELTAYDVVLIRPGALPRTSSGKVRRGACRRAYLEGALPVVHASSVADGAPVPGLEVARPGPVAPEDALSYLRAELARRLGTAPDAIAVDRSLAAAGLDSLAAIEIQHALERRFGVVVALDALFEAPTLAALADAVAASGRVASKHTFPPIGAGRVRASVGQEAFWFLQKLDPASSAYNVAVVVALRGPLDVGALTGAVGSVARRHEALRTSFAVVDGDLVQVVAAEPHEPVVHIATPEASGAASQAAAALAAAEAAARRPFDLERPPLLRVVVVPAGPNEHVAAFVFHHAVCDGWSVAVFARELAQAYVALVSGREPPHLPPPAQYPTCSAAQREWLAGAEYRLQLGYWVNRLDGVGDLDLPTDFPRPASAPRAGAVVAGGVDAAAHRSAAALARAEDTTVFAVVLAAWQAVLARHCDQASFAVGVPVAARPDAALADAIGYFTNVVPVPVDVALEQPFRDLVRTVRGDVVALHASSGVPFDHLVRELRAPRTADRNPVFQVMFALRPPVPVPELAGVDVEVLEVEAGGVKFDLALELDLEGDAIAWRIRYPAELFEAATVAALSQRLEQFLAEAADDPDAALGDVALLDAAERENVVSRWARTAAVPTASGLVHERFAASAARTPDAPALVFEDDELTYAELDARANRLANRLRELGVGPEVPVALYLERSPELVAALLAILKAGGAYVPFDVSTPPARVASAIASAAIPLVVTRAALASGLGRTGAVRMDADAAEIAARSASSPDVAVDPRNVAYVIFTSGSTGAPKGVAVEHAQLVSYLDAFLARLELPRTTSYRTYGSLAVDGTHTAVFGALCTGGSLHLVADELSFNARALAERAKRAPVDVLKIAPSHLSALLDGAGEPAALLPRAKLVLGGEPIPPELVEQVWALAPGLPIVNQYGPTETTVGVTTHELTGSEGLRPSVAAGRPLPGTEVYVLDRRLHPVPVGVVGEVVVGGPTVARGYVGDPSATAGAYVPAPLGREPGARAYHTGDRARWRRDGTLEFLGRVDGQVKIRGNRVECGDIEAVLRGRPDVADAAVVAIGASAQDMRLVAYLVPARGHALDLATVRTHVREVLPPSMVPSSLGVLDAIPLTRHGKRDEQALRRLPPPRPPVRPRGSITPAEELVAEAWGAVLGVDDAGLETNFFDAGGHSLLLVRLQLELERRHGREIPLVELVKRPTIAAQARYLDEVGGTGGDGRAAEAAAERAEKRLTLRRRRATAGRGAP